MPPKYHSNHLYLLISAILQLGGRTSEIC
uniref:Uncharacterized protein n=1 Tax=Anguilla anguilla TaxID=7936 RepID=A0A0E9QNB3_ANGAN